MNWKLPAGIVFLIVGLLMLNDVRKRKPASDKTNWKGQMMPQYIQYWIAAIMGVIVGLAFILESI